METASLTITEARRQFCQLVSNVQNGHRYLVGRQGAPVAVLINASELIRLEALAQETIAVQETRQAIMDRLTAWQDHLRGKYGVSKTTAAEDLAAIREERLYELAGNR